MSEEKDKKRGYQLGGLGLGILLVVMFFVLVAYSTYTDTKKVEQSCNQIGMERIVLNFRGDYCTNTTHIAKISLDASLKHFTIENLDEKEYIKIEGGD